MTSVVVPRKTLKETARLEGRGLHGGEPVTVQIHPGSEGIAFRLGSSRIVACPSNVTDTNRCTRLGEVNTIEHLMSALAGLEVTDAEIELSAPELPGLDGSAKEYVRAIQSAGLTDWGTVELHPLFKRVLLQEDQLSMAASSGTGKWRYEYDVAPRWPGHQAFEIDDVCASYVDQVAPARTFALEEEIPHIQAMGLGRGLDEDSALILGSSSYVNRARFEDEPARHKLLDLIGDLYLAGIPIRWMNVVAVRSGHATNVRFAQRLVESIVRS
jgi:UDP-3-O-acyl-N-acetylglucosamine deacetylase